MPLLSMPRRLRMPHQSSEHKQDKQDDEQDSAFECNICLEVAKDAVVSMCGHLFCWTCLYRWLDEIDSESINSTKSCPVCRSVVTLDRIIPIYGRGGDANSHNDPRHRLHPRPPGLRTEVSYPQEQIYQINILPIEHPRPEIFGYGFHLTIGFGSLFGYMLLLFYLTKRIEKV